MTVSTEVNENTYTGNGTTTVFPYQFRIFSKSDLVVQVSDLNENVTTLTLDTNYTVSGAGGYRGGNVTLMAPLASGWRISIARELEITQDTDLRNQGKFFAETHEDVFDRLTMLIQQVYRRFGLALRKPSSIAGYYDALGNKIRNLGNPTQAQDAATKDYVDSNLNRTLRVPESFIPELPGASDRANRLHGYDSLGNPAMLLPESGSAADVLLDLADYSLNKGDALVATRQPFTGAKNQTVHTKLAQVISVLDFDRVVGDGVNDDSDGIQRAIDATPFGGEIVFPQPPVHYKITKSLIIDKAITIRGLVSSVTTNFNSPMIKSVGSISVFILKPNLNGYMFGSYGLTGVNFRDLYLEGPGLNNNSLAGISTDNTVNNGVYHIRGCSFTNVEMRYFDRGWDIAGVCYLNNWFNCRALWCGRGCVVDKVPGATEGASDQNRWFGCEFVLCQRGLCVSELGYSGSNALFGCTLSEGVIGLVCGYNVTLGVYGCQIENNSFHGVNISWPAGVNPNMEGAKVFSGNCFLFNNYDFYFDKSQNTVLSGGFAIPVTITGNSFILTKSRVLEVIASSGGSEFDSRQFRLLSDNVFSGTVNGVSRNGPIPPEMITPGWKGYNGYKEDGKTSLSVRMTGNVSKNVLWIKVPYGKQVYIKYRMASVLDNSSSGVARDVATLNFVNATDFSSPSVIKTDTGYAGELFLTREQTGVGMDIQVQLAANASDRAGILEIEYCLM